MGLVDTVGIVLSETKIKESSKMLTILLRDKGKYSVLAKNIQNPKSKLMSSCQLFTYSDFTILEKDNLKIITKAECINNFYTIREDYYSFCVASFFVEIINKSILDEVEVNEILFLLFLGLDNLSMGKNQKQTLLVFIVKFLQLSGDVPPISFCSICSDNIEKIGFFSNNGMVCKKCKNEFSKELSYTEIYTLKYILNEETSKCFSFSIPEKNVEYLLEIFKKYLKNNLEYKINTLELI